MVTELKLDKEKTALIIIDMQNDLVKDDAGPFRQLTKVVRENNVVENIANLLRIARKSKIPIFHIKSVHRADGSDVWHEAENDYASEGVVPASILAQEANKMIEGTPGADFVSELTPGPGEYVISKRRCNAFYGTDLEMLLRRAGADTLILAGVATGMCVESLARAAKDRDFNIVVASDGCADMVAQAHEHAMKVTFRRIGRVRTTKEITSVLQQPS